jgi:hypothetical protein
MVINRKTNLTILKKYIELNKPSSYAFHRYLPSLIR